MRAVVLVPVLKQQRENRDAAAAPATASRSVEAKLEEAKGLALAIDLEVTQGLIVPSTSRAPQRSSEPARSRKSAIFWMRRIPAS